MKSFPNIKNKGFTLVETLVAISILSLAITGPLVIAQKGIGSAVYARDEITAFYLAQEAVEYARNVRDTNRIGGYAGGWLSQFVNANCIDNGSGQRCQVNGIEDFTNLSTLSQAISECSLPKVNGADVCPPVAFDSTKKLYGYSSANTSGDAWANTQFTRTIDIKEINPGVEALVTVTISWQTNIFTPMESFTVAEHIFAF
jgi:prepilin-type N-terminal cleavage/methylation domain-containing protein